MQQKSKRQLLAGESRGSCVDYSIMEYREMRPPLRGFPVEFAALGFLIEEPMHGYALRARIEDGLGPLWQVASSQLYQVLHRLEEQQCVSKSDEAPSSGPSKKIYRATEEGVKAFWEWAQEPVDTMRNVRVEFAAKLYFLRRLKPSAVSTLIDRQLGALEAIEDRVTSEGRKSSDDPVLNEAWLKFQQATITCFYRWLSAHRTRLSMPKEIEE
ncbi:MAG: PadR family transcriptional regulator [Candidatus Atribacteria bacterium]|nr:MAG: PadR family transcriptional regulator [Candidatus Atribacteria bacterium]